MCPIGMMSFFLWGCSYLEFKSSQGLNFSLSCFFFFLFVCVCVCVWWFRSCGGLALHRCKPGSLEGCRVTQTAMATVGRDVVCGVCSRSFRREGDKKRHKCVAERWASSMGQPSAYSVWSGSRAEGDWLCTSVHRLCQRASGECTMYSVLTWEQHGTLEHIDAWARAGVPMKSKIVLEGGAYNLQTLYAMTCTCMTVPLLLSCASHAL